MPRLIDVEQGSEEWKALRNRSVTASDAASCLGIGFDSLYTRWEQKMGLSSTKMNYAMSEGVRLEPIARDNLEQHFGFALESPVYRHNDIDYMIASLDAYKAKEHCLIEIKCGPGSFAKAQQGFIPDYYKSQCQHQLEVMELDKMHYYCFNGEKGILLDVYRDTPYIKRLLEEEKKFWDCIDNFLPPEMKDNDYVKILTEDAYSLSDALELVKTKIDQLTRQEKELRAKILDMANGKSAYVGNQRVTKVISQGHVDYDSIPELANVDRNKYRKAPSTSFRITRVK